MKKECEPHTPLSNDDDEDKEEKKKKKQTDNKGRRHTPLSSASTKRRRILSSNNNNKLSASPASSSSSGSGLKSKKEKVRSLSAVAEALTTFQMVSHKQQQQQHPSSLSSSFNLLPNKFSKHCNGVDHASVPRKIRSAMKNRTRESTTTLTDSEKVKKGIESAEKDGIKKSKKPGWSTREAGCGTVTKDEQEVAETLFSLAGMFPPNASDASNETEPECQSLPEDCPNAPFEASGTTQDANACPERSPRGAAKIASLNETVGQRQNDFPESAKFLVPSHSTDQNTTLQVMPVAVMSESKKVALHDSELSLVMGLNVPGQSKNSHIGRQPDKEFEIVGIGSKQDRHVIKDSKENEGPALWPGLSSRASAGINAPYNQTSAAKAPHWLNAAICASKQDTMESCSSSGTIPEVVTHKKPRKKCPTHVHICHLIQSLEVSKGQVKKESDIYECHLTRVKQGSKCGVLIEAHNMNGTRNGISSAVGTVHSSSMRNSHENKNDIFRQHDISQAPPTPRVNGPQNQGFNFLSLSSGGNGLKVNDNFNNGGSRLEPLSKLQVPYFQTLQQQHGLMPMPTPQSQYASTTYHNQLPAAGPQVRLQQPHYYGSPLSGSHYSSTVSNKQEQQNFWAVQLAAAQGRSGVNCSNIVRAQYHNWQSGWHDSSAVSSCAQVILPHSPASLGSRITSISEQQLYALTSSLPPSRTSGLDIHLPAVYEESRNRFHSSGTPSVQLLCDERI
ncbi:hypothetical protein RIF29_12912 [Crotalaria pallida]|uniref:Uncharacterized protein n=1 Tax=Crotalaria pallida TaxID=3830 RepID=A0AAN9P1F7_CROPI